MPFGPSQPAVCNANKHLSQTDQLLSDPVDSERGSCDCSNHEFTWDGAVLLQRFGRIPYACKPKVAMRQQDKSPVISLQCATDHKGTLKPDFFSSGLRYPACSRSLRSSSSGHLTNIVGSNLGYRFTPAEAPEEVVCFGSTDECGARFDTGTSTKPLQTVFPQYPASSSTSPESLWCDGEDPPFLARPRGTETQPRKAPSKQHTCAAAKLESQHG